MQQMWEELFRHKVVNEGVVPGHVWLAQDVSGAQHCRVMGCKQHPSLFFGCYPCFHFQGSGLDHDINMLLDSEG